MRRLITWISITVLVLVLVPAAFVATTCALARMEDTTRPVPREGAAMELHESFVKRAQEGNIDLLFLGDSITQRWLGSDGEGKGPVQVWNRYYRARRAAEFGIG